MRLIWNDNETKLIDDSDDFDRTQYVIVRKVFLRFKENAQNNGEQWIRETFKKIDEIELVERFESNNHTWAYITYADSNDAHRAIREASELDEIEIVLPADTWVQPESFQHTEPDSAAVVDALKKFEIEYKSDRRETAAFESFAKVLLQSMKSTAPSVKEALDRTLPLVQIFEFKLTDAKGIATSLSEFRSIMQCIGQHVCELAVTFRMSKYPKYTDRYFQKLCQYAGSKLTKLALSGVPSNQEWLVALKPLLTQIEFLSIRTSNYDFEYDIDFGLYCPNVKTLHLLMNVNGTLLSGKHPNLKQLTMLSNQFMTETLVLQFMENNPQLVYLEIEANDSNNLLRQIPMHLPHLERLGLHQGYPNITADNLDHLTVMKELKHLELIHLDEDDFDGILICLPKFRQLEALRLELGYDGPDCLDLEYVCKPDSKLITTLASELPQLKDFTLHYCQIDAETLIEFIQNATLLKVLKIFHSGLEITDAILDRIHIIRDGRGMMVLNVDRIHPELNREKIYSTVRLVS